MVQEKLEVYVLGERSKAMQKVARLKKAKRRRRKRSVARHSKSDDLAASAVTTADAHRQGTNDEGEE